jgi:hypothetical protein
MEHYNTSKNRIEINMDVSHQEHNDFLFLEGYVEKNTEHDTFTLHVKPKNASTSVEPLVEKNIMETDIPNAVSKYVEDITGKHFQ